jgi:hypothetical protein
MFISNKIQDITKCKKVLRENADIVKSIKLLSAIDIFLEEEDSSLILSRLASLVKITQDEKQEQFYDVVEDIKDFLAKEEIDEFELEYGTCVEMEHTDKPAEARKIAKTHLDGDPDFYKKDRLVKHEDIHIEEENPDNEKQEGFFVETDGVMTTAIGQGKKINSVVGKDGIDHPDGELRWDLITIKPEDYVYKKTSYKFAGKEIPAVRVPIWDKDKVKSFLKEKLGDKFEWDYIGYSVDKYAVFYPTKEADQNSVVNVLLGNGASQGRKLLNSRRLFENNNIVDDYNKELALCREGVAYCEKKIEEATEDWVKKEYASVLTDRVNRIKEIESTLGRIEKMNENTAQSRKIKSASGAEMDKLVNVLKKVKAGNISQEGMMSYGFDLRNPLTNNNEEALTQKLAVKLGIKITEEDMRAALSELGVKSISDLVKAWIDINDRKSTGSAGLEQNRKINSSRKINQDYQGWKNYETWCVALWLDNDQGVQEMVYEWTSEAEDISTLADQIKDFVEENNPLIDTSTMYTDLLQSAIDEADYYEIAKSCIQEFNPEHPDLKQSKKINSSRGDAGSRIEYMDYVLEYFGGDAKGLLENVIKGLSDDEAYSSLDYICRMYDIPEWGEEKEIEESFNVKKN